MAGALRHGAAAPEVVSARMPRPADTPGPAGSAAALGIAMNQDSTRTTPRQPATPPPSAMRDAVRARLLAGLEAQPARAAAAALHRVREPHSGRWTTEHLRMTQRLLKMRRLSEAREVLLGLSPTPKGLMADATDVTAVERDTEMPGRITSCGNTVDVSTPSPDTGL